MEPPCLPLKSMLEPPKLLRRPLPPKLLPALSGKQPTTSQDAGLLPLCTQENQPETSLMPISSYENSVSNYATEKMDLLSENWILDQRAPTPAASSLHSDDYPLHWDNMSSGPADFPSKRRHKHRLVNVLQNENDGPPSRHPAPEFTFNHIITKSYNDYAGNVSNLLRKNTVSKLHYKIMEENISRLQQKTQDKVHSLVLSSHNLPEISKRIPPRLLRALEEQQAMLQGQEGEDSIHLLYKSQRLQNSQTLYDEQSKILATHCELAMLECLVNGGHALSLKAYFISRLPDLTPLYNSLFYLNLSFNEFWQFPTEIYYLEHLESLKLRNNPFREIPYGIHKLKKLRTFIASFCSLSSLPAGYDSYSIWETGQQRGHQTGELPL
ncbi:hypothetical protein GDO81_004702 [Engystomops pustulosus]|uniref:Leucine-rich repeat-containing protein 63 n=1 Tax=Engystomops pustulosus TaxID=76066 RepID=A0AAV7CJ54_ENGPU|nr:hypothetical protein GDO81_004702 [Engystomops pustulosus]